MIVVVLTILSGYNQSIITNSANSSEFMRHYNNNRERREMGRE